jgi:tetratricopeptide (TPR) repeat protein
MAETLYYRTQAILEQQIGPEHDNLMELLHGLALLYRKQGNYERATELFHHVLSTYESRHAFRYYRIAETQHDFAMLRHLQGDQEQARSLYEQALRTRLEIFGPDHPLTRETQECLTSLIGQMK